MQCSPKVPQQVTNYSVAPTGFPHMQDGYGVSLQVEVLNKVQLVKKSLFRAVNVVKFSAALKQINNNKKSLLHIK